MRLGTCYLGKTKGFSLALWAGRGPKVSRGNEQRVIKAPEHSGGQRLGGAPAWPVLHARSRVQDSALRIEHPPLASPNVHPLAIKLVSALAEFHASVPQ